MVEFVITDHARQMYHERLKAGASDSDIEFRVKSARRCGRKMMSRIRRTCVYHANFVRRSLSRTPFVYLCDHQAVFVMKTGEGKYKLVTCWRWDK